MHKAKRTQLDFHSLGLAVRTHTLFTLKTVIWLTMGPHDAIFTIALQVSAARSLRLKFSKELSIGLTLLLLESMVKLPLISVGIAFG